MENPAIQPQPQADTSFQPAIYIPACVAQHPDLRRYPSAKMLYGALRFRSYKKDRCRVRARTLAKDTGYSVRTIHTAKQRLINLGLLQIINVFGPGKQDGQSREQQANWWVLLPLPVDKPVQNDEKKEVISQGCEMTAHFDKSTLLKDTYNIHGPTVQSGTTGNVDNSRVRDEKPVLNEKAKATTHPPKAKTPPPNPIKPRSTDEKALWCEIFDLGYSDNLSNRQRLLDVGSLPDGPFILRDIIDQAKGTRNPGGFIQHSLKLAVQGVYRPGNVATGNGNGHTRRDRSPSGVGLTFGGLFDDEQTHPTLLPYPDRLNGAG